MFMNDGNVLKSCLKGCAVELEVEDKDIDNLVDIALRGMPVTISNSNTYRDDPEPHKLIKLRVEYNGFDQYHDFDVIPVDPDERIEINMENVDGERYFIQAAEKSVGIIDKETNCHVQFWYSNEK